MTTTSDTLDALRYPIGRFVVPEKISAEETEKHIEEIAAAPAALRAAVKGLSEARLGQPYRPGGWTLRQVAAHLQDGHPSAYHRVTPRLPQAEPQLAPSMENRGREPRAREG